MQKSIVKDERYNFFADGHLQNCYFQLTACRDVVVVAAVVEVKALPVKNISEVFGLD